MEPLLSNETNNDDHDDNPFERFLSVSKRGPFYTTVKEFRELVQKEENGRKMSNPSAENASNRVETMRLRFSNEVIEGSPAHESFELWYMLTSDHQDEFLCRLFLPHVLGGLFQDDDFVGGSLRHGESSDDQDSEQNAYHCSVDEHSCDISSLESDREDNGNNSDPDLLRK